MNRRNFLKGMAGILAAQSAPAFLPPGIAMPIRQRIWTPDKQIITQAEGVASQARILEDGTLLARAWIGNAWLPLSVGDAFSSATVKIPGLHAGKVLHGCQLRFDSPSRRHDSAYFTSAQVDSGWQTLPPDLLTLTEKMGA